MKLKTFAVALALTLAPTLSLAGEGCGWGKTHQAMTCADGTTYDAEAGKCVAVTT